MKQRVLNINISAPCKQVYENMPVSGSGRFCDKCQNTVYDFSQMTDNELLRFIEANHGELCGKFHNSQLNRGIAPVHFRKNSFQKAMKIAASIIAFLSLRSTTANAQKNTLAFEQTPLKRNQPVHSSQDSVLIKGRVTVENYGPLPNVLVSFGNLASTTTDQNGYYNFHIGNVDKAYNIYFRRVNYVPTVRTYSPAMGSTDFNIVMGERDSDAIVYSNITMGVPALNPINDFLILTFKGSSISLTSDDKLMLNVNARKLKENPFVSVTIVAYRREYESIKIPQTRALEIKKYFVNKQGISESRISFDIEESSTSGGVVEFKSN